MKITTKITLITILAMVSMVGITAYSFLTTNKVKVTGDLYKKIEINSDLTADILPPPFYLIETYLTTYQIITNYKNMSLIQQIKTLQQLKRDYFDRYNYWMETLPEGELKKTVTVLAFSSSERFFKVLDSDFIPALQDRDITTATIILNQTLTPIYLEHKRFIDSAVKIAEDESNKLEEETTRSLKFSATLMIIVPSIFIVIIFVIGALIKTSISISMKKVLKGFQITSEGDLRHIVENLSKDELGIISSYLNKMTKNMSSMIGDVKNTSINLSETSLLLSNNMNDTADSIEDITNSITHIDVQMNRQMSGVQEAQTAIDEIVNRIESLNIQIENQSASVTQSSSAVEEMVANISSVNSILKKNSISVEQLKKASELGKVGMGEVADNINGIRNESEGLIEATNIIQNIASQTNLLAMNAAIEAAHAGDAGKGFAVVADEIRKLAEDSNNQVVSISQILKKFKDSITTVAEYSDTTQKQFDEIFNLSTVVSDQENIISSAMDEQNTGGSEILNAMRQISEITETVRDYSSEIMDNSHGVILEMKTLNTISHEVNDKVNKMSQNSTKISKSSNETQLLSQKNKESIDNLLIEISSFKIDND